MNINHAIWSSGGQFAVKTNTKHKKQYQVPTPQRTINCSLARPGTSGHDMTYLLVESKNEMKFRELTTTVSYGSQTGTDQRPSPLQEDIHEKSSGQRDRLDEGGKKGFTFGLSRGNRPGSQNSRFPHFMASVLRAKYVLCSGRAGKSWDAGVRPTVEVQTLACGL